MLPIRALRRALSCRRGACLCRKRYLVHCPLHGGDPSLRLVAYQETLLIGCARGCDWRRIRDHLWREGLVDLRDRVAEYRFTSDSIARYSQSCRTS